MSSASREEKQLSDKPARVIKLIAQWAVGLVRVSLLPLRWIASQSRLADIPRGRLAASAAFWFIIATGVAVHQYVAPYAWHQPYRLLRWQWWLHPLEWNLDDGLPKITGDINAIAATPNAECLWIAGNAGLLAFTPDKGESWTQLDYIPASGEFRAPDDTKPCWPGQTKPAAGSRSLLVPEVYAQSAPSSTPQQSKQPLFEPQSQKAAPSKNSNPAPPTGLKATVSENQQQTARPALQVFPPQVVFSSVLLNSSSPASAFSRSSVQVKNVSPSVVLLSQIALSPSMFRVDSGSRDTCSGATLQPNTQCTVPLIFSPIEPGKFEGRLQFFSSNQAPWIVQLLGTAEPGPSASGYLGSKAAGPGKRTAAANGQPTSAKPNSPSANPAPSAPPDLWAFSFFQPNAAAIVSAEYYDYTPFQQGLTWRRSLSSVPTPEFLETTDRMLEFEKDDKTGNYHIKSVEGWCCRDTPIMPIVRWEPSTQQLQVTNQAERLLRTIVPLNKPAGDFTSLSVPNSAEANQVWGINFSASPLASYVLHSKDGGATWEQQEKVEGETLKSVHFQSDNKTGWVVGDHGVVLTTTDGGATWQPLTAFAGRLLRLGKWEPPKDSGQYVRFIPPWYVLALFFCGVIAAPVLFPVDKTTEPAPSVGDQKVPVAAGAREADSSTIGNQAIADKPLEPGDPDALGLGTIAAGLAFFLRNEKTKPPLAIAINGRWGSGKTSLMNLLKGNLESVGSHPVWFNAWHHQKEDQMLAALLQAVKTQAVPPVWERAGAWFRVKLAFRRFQKYWFHLLLMAVLVVIVWKTGVFISNTFHLSAVKILQWIANIGTPSPTSGAQGAASPPGGDTASRLSGKPIFTIAAIAAAVYKIVTRGLTAFGANPAALLTSVSGTTNIKALDAQTSFRQRFASEFNDVTLSLGKNQRMLILIDDLDRCRPEKVREVLEGVNFLASSGDCFIVLGMARDIVEHCVGLSFARVVDSMSWEAMGLTQDDIDRAIAATRRAEEKSQQDPAGAHEAANNSGPSFEILAKRRAFAHLYLDKLIQIEVTVPQPSPLQRRLLFRSDEEIKKELGQKEQQVQQLLGISRRIYSAVQPLLAMALVGLVLFGGWVLVRPVVRNWVVAQFQPLPPDTNNNNKETSSAGASTAVKPSAGGSNTLGTSAPPGNSASGTSAVSSQNGAPSSTAGGRAGESAGISPYGPQPANPPAPSISQYHVDALTAGWPFLLVFLGTVSIIASSLRSQPQRVVSDEKPFTNALAIWHPLVMTGGARNTPRTARRFQNRVRYLAMRQRALLRGKALSLGERWLRDRLHSPIPRIDQPIHLPENLDLDPDLTRDVDLIRQQVEAGSNAKVGPWTIDVSAERIDISGNGGMPGDQVKALVLGNIYIPEPVLIALAAIEEYEPSWILKEDLFRENVVPASTNAKESMFARTLKEHQSNFPDWHNLEQYRRSYLGLCSELSQD